jgi:hypothetical protein
VCALQFWDSSKSSIEFFKSEKSSFKVMTGYGSESGSSKSKEAVLKSLSNMVKEGMIKGYLPGEVKDHLITPTSKLSRYLEDKLKFESLIKKDLDYGNPGIVFVFK